MLINFKLCRPAVLSILALLASACAPAPYRQPVPAVQPATKPVAGASPKAVAAPSGTRPAGVRPVAASQAATTAKPPISRPAIVPVPGDDLTDAERRKLAALPLPNLPSLAAQDLPPPAAPARPAATDAAATGMPRNVANDGELQALLRKARDRTGLGDAQLTRIAALETAIGRGERDAALLELLRLNNELDDSWGRAVVGNGDNLWVIAAKPEVYGNANLWPLIWRANPKSLPRPDKLRIGHGLRFPRYPGLGAVAEAIDYASRNPLANGGRP